MWMGGGPDSAFSRPARAPFVAVLPFDNLSRDEGALPFTDGVHDDLLTQLSKLSKLSSLRVINRGSLMEYRDSPLSAETVFDIQSTMAARIASALEAELGPETAERIARRPTDDLRAYELHVQAKEIIRQGVDPDNQRAAMVLWEEAVELDPSFALAHAYLSIHNPLMWAWHRDDSPARLERGREAADRALALDPDLAEAHVRRRQGRFEEALELQRQVVELDPRNAVELWQLGITQRFLRDYEGANRSLDRAIELSPTYWNPYFWKAQNIVLADGDTEAARQVLDRSVMPVERTARLRARLRMLDGDYEAALSLYSSIPADRVRDDHLDYTPHHLFLAEASHYLGRSEAARRHWEAARRHLEARLEDSPEDPRLHGSLGVALAGLGEDDEPPQGGAADPTAPPGDPVLSVGAVGQARSSLGSASRRSHVRLDARGCGAESSVSGWRVRSPAARAALVRLRTKSFRRTATCC